MMLDYDVYLTLYKEALLYDDVDMYIAERGWQEWMNQYSTEKVSKILMNIFEISRMSVLEIRTLLGLSRAAFSRAYNIPLRTLENWDAGTRKTPGYVRELISYTALGHLINKES